MRSLFNSLLSYFLTPAGVLVMGALDASVVFFLPLGIDFVVIIMTARKPELFWLYALLAAGGSVIGAALTFWMGRKAGEHGLSRLVRPSTLKRVQQRVTHSAAIPIAALGVIPPPFPFTAFILASGAWKLNPWTFLSTVAVVRVVRFGVEGALAARYGKGILTWMESTTFTVVIIALAVLAIGGTIASAVAVYRGARSREGGSGMREQERRARL
jgi:membrane protein YqaA with SNARE-associated domain